MTDPYLVAALIGSVVGCVAVLTGILAFFIARRERRR